MNPNARSFIRTRGNMRAVALGGNEVRIPAGSLLTHFEIFDEGRQFIARWNGEQFFGYTWEWRKTLGLDPGDEE